MQDQREDQDTTLLRKAAVSRAQVHQGVVEANSQCLADAAQERLGLDSDPRSFEHWLLDWPLPGQRSTS